jgi:hypothetical protein
VGETEAMKTKSDLKYQHQFTKVFCEALIVELQGEVGKRLVELTVTDRQAYPR